MQRAIDLIVENRIAAARAEGLFNIRLGPDVPLDLADADNPDWFLARKLREEREVVYSNLKSQI